MAGKLTDFLSKVVEMRWSEFVELERSMKYSAYEGIVIGIVRSCTKGSRKAITEALDRLDGKVAENIEINYPKFHFLFPNATSVESGAGSPSRPTPLPAGDTLPEPEPEDEELPTGKLRPALAKMLDEPMEVVHNIIAAQKYIDDTGSTAKGDPGVKGVVVAHLVRAAVLSKHSMGYASEVLDQIDGKVATQINVMGSDVYINRYDAIAPAGSYKNKDGVYVFELPMVSDVWSARIDNLQKQGRLKR